MVQNHLLKKDARWNWTGSHTKAVERVKRKAVVEFTPPAHALSPRVAHCASSGCSKRGHWSCRIS
ncbi:hypothetical protein T4D_2063 [Trichinella pseudospiralis]|uniref:Uncharacterized protein n=1 Tax=Trichinella pseudospiralis TaxID=6337 RepID=A0A0V1G0L3_TRIPS|nr:hypothetical protein T4D_2063 [Trichinella pseudospiralis]